MIRAIGGSWRSVLEEEDETRRSKGGDGKTAVVPAARIAGEVAPSAQTVTVAYTIPEREDTRLAFREYDRVRSLLLIDECGRYGIDITHRDGKITMDFMGRKHSDLMQCVRCAIFGTGVSWPDCLDAILQQHDEMLEKL